MSLLTWLSSLIGMMVVSLMSGPVWAAPPGDEVLRVAVHMGAVRDATRADIEVSLGVWANELTGLLEVPSEVKFYDSLTEVHQALQAGTSQLRHCRRRQSGSLL